MQREREMEKNYTHKNSMPRMDEDRLTVSQINDDEQKKNKGEVRIEF